MGRLATMSDRATPESYVVQANRLARSRYAERESIHAVRLIHVAMSKVNGDLDMFNTIRISNQELRDIFPTYARNMGLGTVLNEAADRMLGLRFEICEGPDDWRKLNVIQEVSYKRNRGGLRISFHPDMKSYLLKLSGNYTRYQLKCISDLASTYHISVYNYLRSHAHHRRLSMSIEDLRGLFSLGKDDYPQFREVRRRLLEPAITAINEKTDILVSFELRREGRFYSHIDFTISEKPGEALSEITEAAIQLMVAQGVSKPLARQAGVTMPLTQCLAIVAHARLRASSVSKGAKPITDLGAYTAALLREAAKVDTEEPDFKKHYAAVMREYRQMRFELMSKRDQESVCIGFRETLTGKLAQEFDRFQGDLATTALKMAFAAFLAEIISPDAPTVRMSMG